MGLTTDQIAQWLRTIGTDYYIHEAYHRIKRGLLPPHDHFVFNVISKQLYDGGAIYDASDTGYNLVESLSKRYLTTVSVNAYSEHGYDVLAALDMSKEMVDVRAIFGTSVALLGLRSAVNDLTEIDETEEVPRWRYQADFAFYEYATYSRTQTDMLWTYYNMTGKTTTDEDSEETHIITNQP